MTFEILSRVRKEFTLTGQGLYEIILAIAERVNRKVQVLQLHWQAANITDRIHATQQDLGAHLCTLTAPSLLHETGSAPLDFPDAQQVLQNTAVRVSESKQALLDIEHLIRELKLEALQEDLSRLHQDLSLRSAAIERVVIVRGAAAAGSAIAQLALPPSIRIVAIFRGPFLLPPTETLALRVNDILVLVGLQADLARALPSFSSQRPARTA